MCLPAAGAPLFAIGGLEITAGTLLGAASSVFQYIGQSSTANAQQASINEQTQVRQEELRQSQAANIEQTSLEALKQRAQIRAAAGESGVTGGSVTAQLNESRFNEGQDLATINANASSALKSTAASHQRQSNQVQHPSLISTGLQIGSTAYMANANSKSAGSTLVKRPDISKESTQNRV